jgi:hypothetical protein
MAQKKKATMIFVVLGYSWRLFVAPRLTPQFERLSRTSTRAAWPKGLLLGSLSEESGRHV